MVKVAIYTFLSNSMSPQECGGMCPYSYPPHSDLKNDRTLPKTIHPGSMRTFAQWQKCKKKPICCAARQCRNDGSALVPLDKIMQYDNDLFVGETLFWEQKNLKTFREGCKTKNNLVSAGVVQKVRNAKN